MYLFSILNNNLDEYVRIARILYLIYWKIRFEFFGVNDLLVSIC